MTPTSGYTTTTRFGFFSDVTAYSVDAGNFFAFGGIVYQQPEAYRTNRFKQGYGTEVQMWIGDKSVDGSGNKGVTIDNESNTNTDEAFHPISIDKVGADFTHEWTTADANNPTVIMRTQQDWQDSSNTVRNLSGLVSSQSGQNGISALGDVATYLFYYEFDNGTTPTEDYFEITGVHTDGTPTTYEWSPFGDNESCSAYSMKQLICHNNNRFAQQTRPAWTIPLYDDSVSTMV